VAAIQITSNQRVFTAGRTGSGKTFLEHHILAGIKRLVALDPKGTLGSVTSPGWNLTDWSDKGRKALLAGEPVRLRVPAPLNGDWTPYLWDVYRAGNVVLYVDEMYGVVPPGKAAPEPLIACYTRGRELGIGVHAATQRPAWVPLVTMSEADWFFVFRLTLDEDRRRLASFMGASVMSPIRDRYGFYSYHPEWDDPIYTPRLIVRKPRATKGRQ
jgi:hypothetical protein